MTEENIVDAPSWRDNLTDDYREKYSEFKTENDLMKGYDSLVQKMGTNPLVRPKEDASEEDLANYRSTLKKELGAPEDISGYGELTAPEGLEFDEGSLNSVKNAAFELGVAPDQFEGIVNAFMNHSSEQFKAFDESQEAKRVETTEALQKEWGLDAYENKVQKLDTFIQNNFGEDIAKNNANNIDFIRAVDNIYNRLEGGSDGALNAGVSIGGGSIDNRIEEMTEKISSLPYDSAERARLTDSRLKLIEKRISSGG